MLVLAKPAAGQIELPRSIKHRTTYGGQCACRSTMLSVDGEMQGGYLPGLQSGTVAYYKRMRLSPLMLTSSVHKRSER